MTPADHAAITRSLVVEHLRELPTSALDAVMDLITIEGSQGLTEVIADEFSNRHPSILRSTDP